MEQHHITAEYDLINYTHHYINMIVVSIVLSSFATLFVILT